MEHVRMDQYLIFPSLCKLRMCLDILHDNQCLHAYICIARLTIRFFVYVGFGILEQTSEMFRKHEYRMAIIRRSLQGPACGVCSVA